MKNNTTVRHILDRPQSAPKGATLANAGPMAPQQVRAMWAKRNDPNAASASDRPYIPVPRVPVPGYEPKPPQTGASESIPAGRAEPTPPRDPRQDIWDMIKAIRERTSPETGQTVPRPPMDILDQARNLSVLRKNDPRAWPTPGHPNPDKPWQTPPYIPAKAGSGGPQGARATNEHQLRRDKYGRVIGGGTRVIGGVTVPGPQY